MGDYWRPKGKRIIRFLTRTLRMFLDSTGKMMCFTIFTGTMSLSKSTS